MSQRQPVFNSHSHVRQKSSARLVPIQHAGVPTAAVQEGFSQ